MDKKHDERAIDCVSFENRIQDLMDRRIALTSDQLLLQHSESCEGCRQMFASFQSLESVLSTAFLNDCLADSDLEVSTRPNFLTSATHWGVAAAIVSLAAILLVAFVPIFNQPSNGLMIADNAGSSLPAVVDAPESSSESAQPSGEMINLVSYETIPPSLRNAYQYAAELPGIRPIECSVTVTIEALQKSWSPPEKPKQEKENPDLGQFYSGHNNGLA